LILILLSVYLQSILKGIYLKTPLLSLILIAFLSCPVKSQWLTYTSQNTQGLVGTMVTSITDDNNNDLWFATDEGVVKHDVVNNLWPRYNTYNGLADNFVYKVFKSSGNTIWATTSNGVSKYNTSTNNWTTYTTTNGLAGNIVRGITEGVSSTLWFATYGGGVSKYTGNSSWTTYDTDDGLVSNLVNCAFADADHHIWFGTASGVSEFFGNWTTYTTSDGLPSNTITNITQAANGDMWFATTAGVARFDGITWTVFNTSNGLSDNLVYDVFADDQGKIWVATDNGVCVYDGISWEIYNTTDGMANSKVYSVFQDVDQSLWFGLNANGVSVFDGSNFTNIDQSDGLKPYVNDICEDGDGNLWFANSYYGATKFDGNFWTNYTAANSGIGNNSIFCIASDHLGNVWFGTYNEVIKFDGINWTHYANSTLYGSINCIFEDSDNNLWFGTDYGVTKYNRSTFTAFTTNNGLADNYCNTIGEDAVGNIWCGSYYRISIYNGSSWTINDPFAEGDFNAFYEIFSDHNGTMWLAASSGILKQGPNSTWTLYTETGMSNYALNEDEMGRIWAGSYNHLTLKNGNNWGYYYNLDGVVPYYTKKIFRDSNNLMWIAHDYGVTRGIPALATSAEVLLPEKSMASVYPNPFYTFTTIEFDLDVSGNATLDVYDLKGSQIANTSLQQVVIGKNTITIDGSTWPSGIYCGVLHLNGNKSSVIKIVKAN
jgi:ligand-binding sensor domain-containing protein